MQKRTVWLEDVCQIARIDDIVASQAALSGVGWRYMKQVLLMIAVVALVGCGGGRKKANAEANKLFAEAAQLIESAEEKRITADGPIPREAAIKDYDRAFALLRKIIADYGESDLAAKLISGETTFTGISLREIKIRAEKLKADHRDAAWRVERIKQLRAENMALKMRQEKEAERRAAKVKAEGWLSDPSDPQNVIVEKAIRKELNKPTGDLTKADLATVTALNLGDTKITDEALKEIAKLQNLTELHLFRTKITDEGLKELTKLQNLTVLHLDYTKITDAGLKEVAKLQKLGTLWLSYTQITDAGLKDLAKLQQLKYLFLDRTQITDKNAAELKKALPKCDIIW